MAKQAFDETSIPQGCIDQLLIIDKELERMGELAVVNDDNFFYEELELIEQALDVLIKHDVDKDYVKQFIKGYWVLHSKVSNLFYDSMDSGTYYTSGSAYSILTDMIDGEVNQPSDLDNFLRAIQKAGQAGFLDMPTFIERLEANDDINDFISEMHDPKEKFTREQIRDYVFNKLRAKTVNGNIPDAPRVSQ